MLKLEASALKVYDWDDKLPKHFLDVWIPLFTKFLDVPKALFYRCTIPPFCVDPKKVRILCTADAGEACIGVAIYATYLQSDGTFEARLLYAKSKLSTLTVPRNELEAVRMMVEAALEVNSSINLEGAECVFLTDSTVALCWALNTSKRLKTFTLNRVITIRGGIQALTKCGNDDLPLFHIPGAENPADLLTKCHSLGPKELAYESEWQNGPAWMSHILEDMPLTKYSDLSVSQKDQDISEEECFKALPLSSELNSMLLRNGLMHEVKPTVGHPFDCVFKTAAHGLKTNHMVETSIQLGWNEVISRLSKVIQCIYTRWHDTFLVSRACHDPKKCMCCVVPVLGTTKFNTTRMWRSKAQEFLLKK